MKPCFLTERYLTQSARWPKQGRHILAQFDEDSVIVYQAYRPEIGNFAVENGYFGGEFSYSRMSWIKPNFLWMMYRSGWGTKTGQEITLAVRIRRKFFDDLLIQALESSYSDALALTYEEWEQGIKHSPIRIQWDPDHHPGGAALPRRALQIGLRWRALKDYGKREIIEIIDLSDFVSEQRINTSSARIQELVTPLEQVYMPADPSIRTRLRLE